MKGITESYLSGPDAIESESELLKAFRMRDQKHVEMPYKARFPLEFDYYLTWSNPSGGYRYLVIRRPRDRKLIGLVFKRSHHGSWVSAARMCDWCHAYGPADQIDMLTIAPDSRRTVGMLLCVDLSCIEKIEIVGKMTRKSYERLASELCERIVRFHEQNLESRAKSS